ncbi:hypothetical protein LIER_43633 [Lithospermum erythrorhizon]|uniref:Reverse transcriptase domain-containing protein n=1 Tax=Lithospermum erythrorhizon TaxID=34254 RepID=A0AAV3QLU2_LITER
MDKLVAQPSMDEVHDAIFSQSSGKSPGLDGYGIEFYKHNWESVGQDVYKVLVYIFATGDIPSKLSATTISLIPKTEHPKGMTDYRPIACCNNLYKWYHKPDGGVPKAAVKVDLQKAYDTIEWSTLWVVMEQCVSLPGLSSWSSNMWKGLDSQ